MEKTPDTLVLGVFNIISMRQYLITEKQIKALISSCWNAGEKFGNSFPADCYIDWYNRIVIPQLDKLPKTE